VKILRRSTIVQPDSECRAGPNRFAIEKLVSIGVLSKTGFFDSLCYAIAATNRYWQLAYA
jgi:hypothetical protein